MDPQLRERFRFFLKRAGYVVGQRALGAFALAKAEEEAEHRNWTFEWEWDPNGSDTYGDHEEWCKDARVAKAVAERRPVDRDRACNVHVIRGCEHGVEGCILKDGDEVLTSLWGIIDADRYYRRVIKAELAWEALRAEEHEQRETAEIARMMAL